MDGQPRSPAPRTTLRGRIGHLHPYLREGPRLVLPQLAPPHVGGVVHYQHHIREVVLADRQCGPRQPGVRRMQVHRLVRLHDELRLAVLVAFGQVGAAEALHRRPAHRGNELGQPGQVMHGAFVVGADRIADPGGLGGGVPVLESHLALVEFFSRQTDRPAAGEVGRRRRHCARRRVHGPNGSRLRGGRCNLRTERAHRSHAGNVRHAASPAQPCARLADKRRDSIIPTVDRRLLYSGRDELPTGARWRRRS